MCLKIKIKPAAKSAISFALDKKRLILSFFLISLTIAALFFSVISAISFGFNTLAISAFVAVVALVSILSLLIKSAFVHNYTIRDAKENLSKSIDALNGRVKPLVYAVILVAIVSIALNSIPFIGGLLNLIFSLAVIFSSQEIMLAKKGAIDSLKGSYRIFVKNWRDVVVSFLAIIFINFLIIILASMPFAIPFAYTVADISANAVASDFFQLFLEAAATNIGLYFIAGAIFVAGISIANLFSIGFTTDVYLQLSGAKKSAEKRPRNKTKRKSRKKRKR